MQAVTLPKRLAGGHVGAKVPSTAFLTKERGFHQKLGQHKPLPQFMQLQEA
jgi:hypothetical protein